MPRLAIVLRPSCELPLLAARVLSPVFFAAADSPLLERFLAAEAPLLERFFAALALRLLLLLAERLEPLDPFDALRPRLELLDLARCFAAGIAHLQSRPLGPSPRSGTRRYELATPG
jgi:hypothetical protein